MKMYLVLGDWSDDGHGKTDKILIESNCTVAVIQQAYRDSCKLTGISFNGNEDFTERDRDWQEANKYRICTAYDDCYLTEEVREILKKFNCPFMKFLEEDEFYVNQEIFVELWFWFISLSLEGFEYKTIKDDIPVINGYWGDLNVQFGYGMYN